MTVSKALSGTPEEVWLTLNVGSSSIKFAVFERHDLLLRLTGQVNAIGGDSDFKAKLASGQTFEHQWTSAEAPADHVQAIDWVIDWLGKNMEQMRIVAIGHRVVHGGLDFTKPVLINDQVIAKLKTLEPLAPLHQPHNLAGIEAARQAFGQLPQVACFDTAFHSQQPFVKDCFALPRSFYEEGVRRYGFHGLSYEYIAAHLQQAFPMHANARVIVAHLGNGASMCAMHGGHSIASTMGFSALDGLPMGTRCGQLDPGVLLYLMQENGMSVEAVSDLLYKESGLKGLSGISNDMRVLESSDEVHAQQAIDYFVYRIKREIGALSAALEGLDALVFTGGIGENSVGIRERVLQAMGWLGVELEQDANRAGKTIISTKRSRVMCLVIPTNEEHMIAEHTQALIDRS